MAEDVSLKNGDPSSGDGFSPQEEQAIDTFLKSFSRAVTAASMYFETHPSFDLAVRELKDKLSELGYFRDSLDMGFTPDAILIDGKRFKDDSSRCRETAALFHKRKIKRLTVDGKTSLDDLRKFVFLFAHLDENLRIDDRTASDVMPPVPGIYIEGLDYSSLLSLRGNHPEDIWKMILYSDLSDVQTNEQVRYVLDHFGEIVADILSLPQDRKITGQVLSNFEELSRTVLRSDPEKREVFSKALVSYLVNMGEESQAEFLGSDRYQNMKRVVSEGADRDFVLNCMLKRIIASREFNPLLLDFYNSALGSALDEQEFADQLTDFLKGTGRESERERIGAVLEEMILADETDKFISRFYRNTLSFMAGGTGIRDNGLYEKYKDELSDATIQTDYFYTLLDLLAMEEEAQILPVITARLEEAFPYFIEQRDFEALQRALEAVDEKVTNGGPGAREALKLFRQQLAEKDVVATVVFDNIQYIDNLDLLKEFIERTPAPEGRVVEQFFTVEDVSTHKRLKELMHVMDRKKMIKALQNYITTNRPGRFALKEAIDICGDICLPASARLLEELYDEYKKDPFIAGAAIKALSRNDNVRKPLFEARLGEPDAELRKEIAGLLFSGEDPGYRAKIAGRLLGINNFLGMNDKVLIQNIDIVMEYAVPEAVPWLKKLITDVPLLFKNARDELRASAIIALAKIDLRELQPLLPELLKDPNPRIVTTTQAVPGL